MRAGRVRGAGGAAGGAVGAVVLVVLAALVAAGVLRLVCVHEQLHDGRLVHVAALVVVVTDLGRVVPRRVAECVRLDQRLHARLRRVRAHEEIGAVGLLLGAVLAAGTLDREVDDRPDRLQRTLVVRGGKRITEEARFVGNVHLLQVHFVLDGKNVARDVQRAEERVRRDFRKRDGAGAAVPVRESAARAQEVLFERAAHAVVGENALLQVVLGENAHGLLLLAQPVELAGDREHPVVLAAKKPLSADRGPRIDARADVQLLRHADRLRVVEGRIDLQLGLDQEQLQNLLVQPVQTAHLGDLGVWNRGAGSGRGQQLPQVAPTEEVRVVLAQRVVEVVLVCAPRLLEDRPLLQRSEQGLADVQRPGSVALLESKTGGAVVPILDGLLFRDLHRLLQRTLLGGNESARIRRRLFAQIAARRELVEVLLLALEFLDLLGHTPAQMLVERQLLRRLARQFPQAQELRLRLAVNSAVVEGELFELDGVVRRDLHKQPLLALVQRFRRFREQVLDEHRLTHPGRTQLLHDRVPRVGCRRTALLRRGKKRLLLPNASGGGRRLHAVEVGIVPCVQGPVQISLFLLLLPHHVFTP
mmetsp:Transcript_17092/g.42385  ORF Transcript_17092/g.42385 Transcript_17092/m.42385 type:complete len:588 (-) Transcript_17092:1782-3545(-)